MASSHDTRGSHDTRTEHTGRAGRGTGSPRGEVLAGGVVLFAAVMMLVAGFFDALRGVMAIAEDEVFVATADYTFSLDLTGWGWIHLIAGIAVIAVALGLFSGATWARMAAVVVAAVLIVANFLSLPYYPLWSVVAIAFYAFVIWALTTARDDRSLA
ncbi:hypothetical protein GCM10027160_06120 [Streptomyces calidiresistens]|uniref:DUF7144 domain-containing protein n=1 Tax=Streptomyces calidiresistens TaxID=1485586 RepID=A0A7W3XY16_9ACTN|nr:hypothetical protein [Streptomyces calidiresistens]MBB0231665.1 hypothetical protein [Streptomyces calidiresistens]